MSLTDDILISLTTNGFGEHYFYKINRGAFDKISAAAVFEAHFAETLNQSNQLFIIVGSDSALLIHYLIKRGAAPGSRYIFIEPEAICSALIQQKLLSNLPEQIICTTPGQWEYEANQLKIENYFYIGAVQQLNALCTQQATLEEYNELNWHIAERLSQMHWRYSMALGDEAFTIQQISNIADNIIPASVLKNVFLDQTVMILAGGPSLDEMLVWLKENRQKVIVFAVSRISRQLLNNGLEPDFIFSVDPTDLSFDISKEMLKFSHEPIFVYSYHTNSKLVQQWLGFSLYLGNRLPWNSDLNPKNFDGVGPTVTNTAIMAAYMFGFRRIILAGVDLCFTAEGYTHAKGSDEALAGPRFNLTSLQVETNDGRQAPTSFDFSSAVDTLLLQAAQLTHSGCQLINVSGNAAKIKNIAYIPIEQIRFTQPVTDVDTIKHSLLDEAAAHYNDRQSILEELNKTRYKIKGIKSLAAEALTINARMYNEAGVIENHKDKKRLDKIEKQLRWEHKEFSTLLKKINARYFIKITRPFNDADLTQNEAKQLCEIYYTAYRNGAQQFLDLIDDAKARIEARLQEESDTPDFDLIFDQWEKDRSYSRARKWLSAPNLPEKYKQRLTGFQNQYEQILQTVETRHAARAKDNSSLFNFRQRAKQLFKSKKLEELYNLQKGLTQYSQSESVRYYCSLVRGYIAELEHHPRTALEEYHTVITSQEEKLFEDSLLRITQLSIDLDQQRNTYLALQCLAQISPTYLPLYAEACKILGHTDEAIENYCNYIERFPNDTLTQIKLALLYAEYRMNEPANILLDHILASKPNYEPAKKLKKQLNSRHSD